LRSERISSRQNARFKFLRDAVAEPRRHGLALADGPHLVSACIESGAKISCLLLSDGGAADSALAELAGRCRAGKRLVLSEGLFRELTGVATPTGIAVVFEIPSQPLPDGRGDVILLDAVQDAGNVGAILRTAAAAGVSEAWLGPGCAGAWTCRVMRAAQGAHFRIGIREQVDPLGAIPAAGRLPVAAVAHGGTELFELDLAGPVLWLFGNEGAGLSATILDTAPVQARIPLASGVESLNVAAAAAVCMFEARRQRNRNKAGPR
jgi:TrmH family RNA methyltransferase